MAWALAQAGDDRAGGAPFETAFTKSFCFDRVGKRMACVNQNNQLLVFEGDARTPTVIDLEKQPPELPRFPAGVAITADGKQALVVRSRKLEVWDLDAKRKIRQLPGDAINHRAVRLSPSGRLMACIAAGRPSEGP
ncbi:MAG TPA: hypothetical protein VNC50_22505, partial [Planctomycetia bacterium]|nr:hypothetical protein [Planctomycetia bacterium]